MRWENICNNYAGHFSRFYLISTYLNVSIGGCGVMSMFSLPSSFLPVLSSPTSPSASSIPSSLNWFACFRGCELALVLVGYSAAPTQRGELPWWQVKRWTQSTHTLGWVGEEEEGGGGRINWDQIKESSERTTLVLSHLGSRSGTSTSMRRIIFGEGRSKQTRRRPVGRAFCVQHRRLFTHNSYVPVWIPLRQARWRTNYACTCAPLGLISAATHGRCIPTCLFSSVCRLRVVGEYVRDTRTRMIGHGARVVEYYSFNVTLTMMSADKTWPRVHRADAYGFWFCF